MGQCKLFMVCCDNITVLIDDRYVYHTVTVQLQDTPCLCLVVKDDQHLYISLSPAPGLFGLFDGTGNVDAHHQICFHILLLFIGDAVDLNSSGFGDDRFYIDAGLTALRLVLAVFPFADAEPQGT